MREEGCVGGDVTARVGSPHAHRRGEPDGALGDVLVKWPRIGQPRLPRLDGVQPTRQASRPLLVVNLPLRQTTRFSRARAHHADITRSGNRGALTGSPDKKKPRIWHRRSQPLGTHGDEEALVQGCRLRRGGVAVDGDAGRGEPQHVEAFQGSRVRLKPRIGARAGLCPGESSPPALVPDAAPAAASSHAQPRVRVHRRSGD